MAKRPSGLGRGLGALIPQKDASSGAAATKTVAPSKAAVKDGSSTGPKGDGALRVTLTAIDTNPDQPRSLFGHRELEDLANSIKEHGILQPLTVSPKAGGRYELVAGERRYRAAKIAGLSEVPVVVREEGDEKTRFVLALIENIQREDLNPLEEARAYARLTDEYGLTQEAVAQQVGKARSTVANAVRLLELPQEIQDALASGAVSAGSVRALLGVADPARQMALFKKLVNGGMSTRDVEAGARAAKGGQQGRKDPATLAVEEELRAAYGTKATVSRKNGRGKICLEFYSDEEFDALAKKLLN